MVAATFKEERQAFLDSLLKKTGEYLAYPEPKRLSDLVGLEKDLESGVISQATYRSRMDSVEKNDPGLADRYQTYHYETTGSWKDKNGGAYGLATVGFGTMGVVYAAHVGALTTAVATVGALAVVAAPVAAGLAVFAANRVWVNRERLRDKLSDMNMGKGLIDKASSVLARFAKSVEKAQQVMPSPVVFDVTQDAQWLKKAVGLQSGNDVSNQAKLAADILNLAIDAAVHDKIKRNDPTPISLGDLQQGINKEFDKMPDAMALVVPKNTLIEDVVKAFGSKQPGSTGMSADERYKTIMEELQLRDKEQGKVVDGPGLG